MLLIGDFNIKKVSDQNIDSLVYRPIEEDEQWKVHLAMELNDVMNGDAEVEGFERRDMKNIFYLLCTS